MMRKNEGDGHTVDTEIKVKLISPTYFFAFAFAFAFSNLLIPILFWHDNQFNKRCFTGLPPTGLQVLRSDKVLLTL